MTPSQSNHLEDLIDKISRLTRPKYARGAIEHGGDIRDLSKEELLDNAIDEAIDQLVYLLTLKSK
jgi:hypothetical protein